MQVQMDGGTGRIVCEGDLGVAEAAQLQGLLQEALAEADSVAIDLEKVTGIDLAILQLFYSGHCTAKSRGKELALINDTNGLMAQIKDTAGFSGRSRAF